MAVYYANLSFVQFRAMILGIHVYVYIGYMGYRYTVSNFVQYVVTIDKLNLCLYTIFIF
jgi:type IV secretory pathway TrbF-like protein